MSIGDEDGAAVHTEERFGHEVAVEQGMGPVELIPEAIADVELAHTAEAVPRTQWQLFRRRFFRHKMAVISVAVLVALYVLCFTAKYWVPFDPNKQNLLLGPVPPNGTHWFGTDELGRDQFSRIFFAGQISLKIGLAVAVLSTLVGATLGAIAGFFGKVTDQLLMRLTDLFLVVPAIAILAIALKRFGNTDSTIILVLAGLFWMYIARIVRGQVLSIREKEFVEAARAAGASSPRIIVRHILPNIIGPIVVNATLAVATAIITESTLSFLGFGVQPPATSWGNMLSTAEGYVGTDKAYLLYFPGLAILVTVLAVNYLGDGLRDAFDPQSEKHT
ncbi:MAG TPA: ABC transporter permease [Acidimicrobiia bacterium]|jgi:peptide/nickel transport system permease protein